MSKAAIPVIQFLFKADFKSLNEALRLNPNYEIEAYSSASDLATYLSTIPAGLVIASLRDKDDLVQIVTFMKLQKKVAKSTAVKIVVINFSGDRTYEKAIAKLGILDLLEPFTNTKALKFKLDFWMKSLSAQARQNPVAPQKVVKSQDNQSQERADNYLPNWLEPLDLEDDIWILKSESDCKRILGKWLIRFKGPGPFVGQWSELKPGLWRFDLKPTERDMFVPNDGAWYFSGEQKPDFVWKENIWLMTGENFDLFFKNDNNVYSRLKSKDKTLTVAKNSLYAKTKEQVIEESFDRDLVFKQQAQKLDDLEGENKTDTLDFGNLEGKNKTPADRSGNLKGKLEGQEPITQKDLDHAANNSKEKTYWNGKNTYEKDENTAEFGVRPDQLNASPELSAPTDNQHQKYYKNHNETSVKTEREEKDSSRPGREKAVRSATERQLENADAPERNLTEAEREKKEREVREREHHKAEQEQPGAREHESKSKPLEKEHSERELSKAEQESGKDLAGKSKTDHLPNHYSNAQETSKPEVTAKEKEKTQTQWNDQDPSYRGLGDTDMLSSHYGGKKDKKPKENAQKEADDEYEDLFSDVDENQQSSQNKSQVAKIEKARNVLELEKARRERAIEVTKEAVSEAGLEELTKDAKVVSLLSHNGKKISCELNDFFEDTIIFLMKGKEIAVSSEVGLDLAFKYLEKDKKLDISGNVLAIDDDGEGNDFVTIKLSKENCEAFEEFMKLYETRQASVTEFLKRARGL